MVLSLKLVTLITMHRMARCIVKAWMSCSPWVMQLLRALEALGEPSSPHSTLRNRFCVMVNKVALWLFCWHPDIPKWRLPSFGWFKPESSETCHNQTPRVMLPIGWLETWAITPQTGLLGFAYPKWLALLFSFLQNTPPPEFCSFTSDS